MDGFIAKAPRSTRTTSPIRASTAPALLALHEYLLVLSVFGQFYAWALLFGAWPRRRRPYGRNGARATAGPGARRETMLSR